MLDQILSAAASGACNCCSEQAGPVGSGAGGVQMCWCGTDTGAPARALPAEGEAGMRVIFVQCNLLTAPAVLSPVWRWQRPPAEVPQLCQSGWIRLSKQPPPRRFAFSSWWPEPGDDICAARLAPCADRLPELCGGRSGVGSRCSMGSGSLDGGQVLLGRNTPDLLRGRWFTSLWPETQFSPREHKRNYGHWKSPTKKPSVYWLFFQENDIVYLKWVNSLPTTPQFILFIFFTYKVLSSIGILWFIENIWCWWGNNTIISVTQGEIFVYTDRI